MQAGNACNGKNKISSTSVATKSLKVLCIHGYRQNGEVFRQKTGHMRKLMKHHIDFVFVTAPNEVVNTDEPKETDDQVSDPLGQRGWWFSSKDNTFSSKEFSDDLVGFEKSVAVVEAAFNEHGPFDGIFGFSQGASFVSVLCGMMMKGVFKHKVNFAILVSGFKSRCSPHDIYYESKVTLPTLHLFGETDRIIPNEMSQDLLQYFENPVVLNHPGGHYLPFNKNLKQSFLDFFEAVCH